MISPVNPGLATFLETNDNGSELARRGPPLVSDHYTYHAGPGRLTAQATANGTCLQDWMSARLPRGVGRRFDHGSARWPEGTESASCLARHTSRRSWGTYRCASRKGTA